MMAASDDNVDMHDTAPHHKYDAKSIDHHSGVPLRVEIKQLEVQEDQEMAAARLELLAWYCKDKAHVIGAPITGSYDRELRPCQQLIETLGGIEGAEDMHEAARRARRGDVSPLRLEPWSFHHHSIDQSSRLSRGRCVSS